MTNPFESKDDHYTIENGGYADDHDRYEESLDDAKRVCREMADEYCKKNLGAEVSKIVNDGDDDCEYMIAISELGYDENFYFYVTFNEGVSEPEFSDWDEIQAVRERNSQPL